MPSDRETKLCALLVLDQIPGIGLKTLAALAACFGSGRVLLTASMQAFSEIAKKAAALARSDAEIRGHVRVGLRDAERLNMPARTWSDSRYPEMLHNLADSPPALFRRGRANLMSSPCITIVGARKATTWARDFARRLAPAFVRLGYTFVNGMALGIDACAHVEELAAQVRLTVPEGLAVLAELEVDGWVKQRAGLRFKRAS